MLKCWGFWNFTLFLKKNLAICPCFQTILGRVPVSKLNFIKIKLCPIKIKKKNKKIKKIKGIKLEFREIEFQNATIGF